MKCHCFPGLSEDGYAMSLETLPNPSPLPAKTTTPESEGSENNDNNMNILDKISNIIQDVTTYITPNKPKNPLNNPLNYQIISKQTSITSENQFEKDRENIDLNNFVLEVIPGVDNREGTHMNSPTPPTYWQGRSRWDIRVIIGLS